MGYPALEPYERNYERFVFLYCLPYQVAAISQAFADAYHKGDSNALTIVVRPKGPRHANETSRLSPGCASVQSFVKPRKPGGNLLWYAWRGQLRQ